MSTTSPSSSSSSSTTIETNTTFQSRKYPILSPSTHLQIKLTKDNYLSWKTAILPYINGNNILHHIDGSAPAPPKSIPSPFTSTILITNPAYTLWFETDQLLLSVLVSIISESLISSLVGLHSSRDVWLSLEKMFSSQSRARIMQTRYHLATLKKNNLSVTDYFQKAKQYADLLASIGQPLSDSDIITYIFAGLPTEYDSLVTSLNTRLESFSLNDLYGHLLTHELQLEQQTPVPDIGLPVANLVAKSSSPQPPRQFSNGGSGSHFNGHRGRGRGHSYCGHSNGGFSSNNTNRSFCQICLKIGHTAPACWHRFEQHYQPPNGSSTQAFVATTPTSIDQIWYPDTGANNHMTADFSNLNLNVDYYTGQDQVRIGNGQGLHIHHIGSSILYSSTKDFFLKIILHVPHISQNLLSIYQFAKDNNVFFEFHPSFFCIKDQLSGAILLSGKSKDGLYPFHSLHQIKPRAFFGERASLSQWHAHLGHPALRVVRQVLSQHHLAALPISLPPYVMLASLEKVIVYHFICLLLGLNFPLN